MNHEAVPTAEVVGCGDRFEKQRLNILLTLEINEGWPVTTSAFLRKFLTQSMHCACSELRSLYAATKDQIDTNLDNDGFRKLRKGGKERPKVEKRNPHNLHPS